MTPTSFPIYSSASGPNTLANSRLWNFKRTCSALFLDIDKAFDRVCHEGFIYKLISYNFCPGLIRVTHSFLTKRTFQVRIGSSISAITEIRAAVPQGTTLSPTLYSVYTADVPKVTGTRVSSPRRTIRRSCLIPGS